MYSVVHFGDDQFTTWN